MSDMRVFKLHEIYILTDNMFIVLSFKMFFQTYEQYRYSNNLYTLFTHLEYSQCFF